MNLKIDVEIQQYYYDFLVTEFPVAVPRYVSLYQGGVHPAKDYERELDKRVRWVRARYEFRERPARPIRPLEQLYECTTTPFPELEAGYFERGIVWRL